MMFKPFTASHSVLLLVDHQIGTMSWVTSIAVEELKRNAIMLAKTAAILQLPVVLTSSMEEYAQGPLLREFRTILPAAYEARIKRNGLINAMDDEAFAAAVLATGRQRVVLAGVTNDVCTVFPALSLMGLGFDVQMVADAGGSPSPLADDMALRRMEANGATLTSTNQVIAELVGSWSTAEGQRVALEVMMPVLGGTEGG